MTDFKAAGQSTASQDVAGQDDARADIDAIIADFEILDDSSDRIEYLIELGRKLVPLPSDAHDEANRVRGCTAQVWLQTEVTSGAEGPVLTFRGDSDAILVKGLISVALALYSGRPAREIADTDAVPLFARMGLGGQLTRQRSNGFAAMVQRIRGDATRALAGEDSAPANP